MSYSIQKLVSDGTLSVVVLGVEYLQRNDIYMRIAGVETPQSGAPSGYTWSFVDNSTLRILPVVPVGIEVTVYRRTDFDSMYNVYSQNAQFDESTIDENNQQLLYIAQEYFEQGIPGASIEALEYVRAIDTGYYYRFKLTDGSYTPEFLVPISPNTKLANRAMWTRFAAESGYVLAAGDFETGGVLLNNTQVLLDESTQGIYSWSGAYTEGGKVVAAGTDPTLPGSGYVPHTDVTLRSEMADEHGESLIGYYPSITALRLSAPSQDGRKVRVLSWHDGWSATLAGPVGGGLFIADGSDTTSVDNGGTVIVCTNGMRVKRIITGGEDVTDFGAVPDYSISTGSGTDNTAAIQNAIDSGFGRIRGKFGVAGQLVLSKNSIWSDGAIPYYASMQYFGATKVGYEGNAICAISTFDVTKALVKTDIPNGSTHAAGITGVVLDAAGYAKHALEHNYEGKPFNDRQLILNSVLLSGATSHGFKAANVIAIRSNGLHISACDGVGFHHTYGVTDCHHSGLYIHTCNGGLYFGDGCVENQFFGGKLEDLYALPIYAVGSGIGKLEFNGMSLVNNNTMVAKVSGSTLIKLVDCSIGSPKVGSLTAMSAENGGVIKLKDTSVDGYATAFNADNGRIYVGPGCEITTAAWATTANAGRVVIEEKSQTQNITLAASSTVTVDFVGAVPELVGGYFKYAELNFSLLYSNFPQTPAGNTCAFGKLIFGQAGTSVGVTTQLLNTQNSAYIASVSASIVNSTTIRLAITCGASVASGGGTVLATVQLSK